MRVTSVRAEHNGPELDRGYATRHYLMVIAGTAVDAVESAGGLIFDRVGAGWDVKVHTTTEAPEDARALRILGAQPRTESVRVESSDWPDLILIGADVYRGDIQARRIFTAGARRQHTEVAMWGGDWPDELDPSIGTVEHRLSIAARAFKVHAMAAAGLARTGCQTERFLGGKHRLQTAALLLPPA